MASDYEIKMAEYVPKPPVAADMTKRVPIAGKTKKEQRVRAMHAVASLSSNSQECAVFLDMLGLDIKEL